MYNPICIYTLHAYYTTLSIYTAVYLRSEEEVHIAELELYKGQHTAITLLYICGQYMFYYTMLYYTI